MTTLFQFLDAINSSKEDLLNDSEKDYSQFMVNRGLSFFHDTILLVNYLNSRDIPKRMHYDFLMNAVPTRKRFSKWHKAEEDDDVTLLSEHYSCNKNVAQSYLLLLNKHQIEEIRESRRIGGTVK